MPVNAADSGSLRKRARGWQPRAAFHVSSIEPTRIPPVTVRISRLPLTRLATALLALSPSIASAESFRFAGSLSDGGVPANGRHTLRVVAYDAAFGGRALGPSVTLPDVAVVDGRFETRFELAFEVPATEAWLGIEVRGDDGTWSALGAREPLMANATAGGACWSTTGNAGLVADS